MKKAIKIILVLLTAFVTALAGISVYAAKSATLGDVNQDGAINDDDLSLLTKYLADWQGITINITNADINNDGKVTPLDRAILARYLASWSGYDSYFEEIPEEEHYIIPINLPDIKL